MLKIGLRALNWLTANRLLIALPLIGAVAAAVEVLMNDLDSPSWARVLAASAAVVASLLTILATWRVRRATQLKAGLSSAAVELKRRELRRIQLAECIRDWPPPAIRNVNTDFLGLKGRSGQLLTQYVLRDIDTQATSTLKREGVLLLVGPPKSGLTRSAFEVARAARPSASMLISNGPAGLRSAVEELDMLSELADSDGVVIWLDRIDEFNTMVTVSLLQRIQRAVPSSIVVATITSTRLLDWQSQNPLLYAYFGDPIILERSLSDSERARSVRQFPEIDFNDGIAVPFTYAADLLNRRRAGFSTCTQDVVRGDCDVARATINCIAGFVATGTPRPFLLANLAQNISRRLNKAIEVDHINAALKWLTEPSETGQSLISKSTMNGDDYIRISTEIEESLADESSPPSWADWEESINDAVRCGDLRALAMIGSRAFALGCNVVANQAWNSVSYPENDILSNLWQSVQLAVNERTNERMHPLYQLRRLSRTTFGEESTQYTALSLLIAAAWHEAEVFDLSLEIYTSVFEKTSMRLAPNDTLIAVASLGISHTLWHIESYNDAKAFASRALNIFKEACATDNELNIGIALLAQAELITDTKPQSALELSDQSLDIFTESPLSQEIHIADALRVKGMCLIELEQYERAIPVLKRVLDIRKRMDGDIVLLNPRTEGGNLWRDAGMPFEAGIHFNPSASAIASALERLAQASFAHGRSDSAKQMLLEARKLYAKAYGPISDSVSRTDLKLAVIMGRTGQPGSAAAILERVLRHHQELYGAKSGRCVSPLISLAYAAAADHRLDDADRYAREALQVAEALSESSSTHFAAALILCANLSRSHGDLDVSAGYAIRAIGVSRHIPGLLRQAIHCLRQAKPDWLITDSGQVFRSDSRLDG